MKNNERKFTLNKKLLAVCAAVVVLVAALAVLLWPSNIVSELKVEAGRDTLTAIQEELNALCGPGRYLIDFSGVTPEQFLPTTSHP